GACALLGQAHLDLGRLAVQAADQVLEVEQDVGHVLADAGERRELVRDALDLDRGDGGALERREQHAAQRVAEGVAEAAVERLDYKDAAVVLDLLVDDLRNLELHQAGTSCQSNPFLGVTWSRARRSGTPGPARRSPRARGASGSSPSGSRGPPAATGPQRRSDRLRPGRPARQGCRA